MFLYTLCLATLLALAAATCENHPDEDTWKAQFCQADIAFYGTGFAGGSSLSLTAEGQEFAHAFIDFRVGKLLKGTNPGSSADTIKVYRSYEVGSPCEHLSVSSEPGDIVIFGARSGRGVSLDNCQFFPSWNCLSKSFKQHYMNPDFCSSA